MVDIWSKVRFGDLYLNICYAPHPILTLLRPEHIKLVEFSTFVSSMFQIPSTSACLIRMFAPARELRARQLEIDLCISGHWKVTRPGYGNPGPVTACSRLPGEGRPL